MNAISKFNIIITRINVAAKYKVHTKNYISNYLFHPSNNLSLSSTSPIISL